MDRPPLTPDARTLAADLFERYATPVLGRLTRAFPAADPATVCDAFVQAVLEISQDFGRYDPAQASLENFLARATRRTLGNLLRSERRRREREQKKMSGAVTAEASADRSVLERLADRELADRAREAAAHNEGERRALDLWLLGERDPAAYAAALGLGGLPPDEQEAGVHRALARLRQRLHRFGRRPRAEGPDP